jgi:soluble lytic murein transglycosylase-like protein
VLTLIATVAALSAPAAASAESAYVVAPGESLSSVAATDGLSVEQLAAANGLSPEAGLIAGSTLMIPAATGTSESAGAGSEAASSAEASASTEPSASAGTGSQDPDGDGDNDGAGPASSTPAASSPSSGSSASGSYVVQPGDTLTAIAERAGASVESLAAANGLEASALLPAGAVLTLPGASAEAARPTAAVSGEQSAATAQPVGTNAEGSPSEPPFPTEETVTPSEVGSIAAANGVPPSLAEAIASQESGFNNGLTSSADARGVMQILPGTWSYIDESLAGPTPLAPASAASNVRGGVLLLNSLLSSTGGNPELAAAGYYQGLPSVLQEGEFPSTQQYVSEVLERQQQFGGG